MDNTYKKAGVDTGLADRIINKVKPMIHSTNIPGVISEIGYFAGLFSLSQEKIKDPVLVSGTDGVGTKLMIANLMKKHDSIGIDLVAMSVNDILTCGAKPLFFLDYLASGKLEENKMVDIIKGITEGCKRSGCALLGGETAEMPGFYPEGEYDLAGFAVGIVDRGKIINGKTIKPGDIVIGLASSGLHSNGFSLVRKVLLSEGESCLGMQWNNSNCSLGEELLKPTKIYCSAVSSLIKKYQIKGMVHITGGGFYDNIPRVLSPGLSVEINVNQWPILPIFKFIKEKGKIADQEMFHTYNMGIGLMVIVSKDQEELILQDLNQLGEQSYRIGKIISQRDSKTRVLIDY
ncbi:MAG: phosphoribosylformylglycinamidine cyclo-ligase [Candidatus Atribacteria bacterium]|nr:phosphoribosylformylglycinamidine cyclo-ligase [Candidatus Atribacteria bacterium]